MDESTPLLRILDRTWLRRTLLVPLVLAIAAGAIVVGPALLVVAAAIDLVSRRRLAVMRAVAAALLYAVAEAVGVVGAAGVWTVGRLRGRSDTDELAANHAFARWWAGGLFRLVLRLYGVTLEVDGLDDDWRGPFLLFSRHVSLIDTLMPMTLFARLDLYPRYVMKAVLRLDPMLDIMTGRTPNALVYRHSMDSRRQIRHVAALADGLGDHDFVAIYPEGTRFTAEKRARVMRSLEKRGAGTRLQRARSLRFTLPPRAGGPLALLQAAPHADVVFCAHTGFEGLTTLGDLVGGALVGRTVKVRMWRVPAAEIPEGRSERLAWLHDEWVRLDGWVAAHQPPRGPGDAG